MFRKAKKKKLPGRIALAGLPGGGKTLTALLIAAQFAKKVAVINSERYAIEKYVGETYHGVTIPEFDIVDLESRSPSKFTAFVREAVQERYDCLIIDSFSHAWEGTLAEVDKVAKQSNSKNSYFAWRDVTPMHTKMIETIMNAPLHVICTLRQKMAYEIVDQGGKKVPVKMGLDSIARAGVEYEFDLVCDMDATHLLRVSKTRRSAMDGETAVEPGPDFFKPFFDWLDSGSDKQELGEMPSGSDTDAEQVAETASPKKADTGSPPNGAYDPIGSGRLATKEQCERLRQLLNDLEVSKERRIAMLKKRDVTRYEQLTFEAIDSIIEKLVAQQLGTEELAKN